MLILTVIFGSLGLLNKVKEESPHMQSFVTFLLEQETDPSIVGPMISTRDYADRMMKQGKKFLKYGREKGKQGYDPKYDYGGAGDVPRDSGAYGRVMQGVVRGMMRDEKIGEDQLDDPTKREQLITRYRGASRDEDSRYFDVIDRNYKSGGKNCVGSFCDAIIKAETGSFKDPFIRTVGVPGSSSTAYGPGQITLSDKKGTLPDMVRRHPDLFSDKDPRHVSGEEYSDSAPTKAPTDSRKERYEYIDDQGRTQTRDPFKLFPKPTTPATRTTTQEPERKRNRLTTAGNLGFIPNK